MSKNASRRINPLGVNMVQHAKKVRRAIAASICVIASLVPRVALSQVDTWQPLPPMPTARVGGASGAIGGKVYFTNGQGDPSSATSSATSLEVYDPASNSWTTRAPSPTYRSLVGSAAVGDVLYVIGGCFQSDCRIGLTNLTQAYNSTTDTWATVAPMPTPRSGPAVGVINGKIYVAGGATACPPCVPQPAALEVFDPTANSWGTKAPIPTPRESAAGAVVNGKLYVIGGFVRPATCCSGTITNIVEIYDPSTDTWTTGAPMPTARYLTAAGAIGGLIHVIGGQTETLALATHEVYDPATNTWSTKAPMTVPRYFLMAAGIDPKLYAAGGGLEGGVITNYFEVYTANEVNTPGKVTGGGYIRPDGTMSPATLSITNGSNASIGGKATFGFAVQFTAGNANPTGNLQYNDHGANVTIKALSFTLLAIGNGVCGAHTHAKIKGSATVTGPSGVPSTQDSEVEVDDCSSTGSGPDTFKITTLGTTPYMAAGPVVGGNITIH